MIQMKDHVAFYGMRNSRSSLRGKGLIGLSTHFKYAYTQN